MIINYNDLCKNCKEQAISHTSGVFYPGDSRTFEELQRLLPDHYYVMATCRNFVPKDNLKYVEWKYLKSLCK